MFPVVWCRSSLFNSVLGRYSEAQPSGPTAVAKVAIAALASSFVLISAVTRAQETNATPDVTTAMQIAKSEAPFLSENDVAMKRMMIGMSVKPTGDVNRDFVEMMVPHHQGAIDMALAYLRCGRNEQLRRIAQEIIVDQQQEIAAMRLALGDPLPASKASPTQMAAQTSSSDTMHGIQAMPDMNPNMKMSN